LPQKVIRDWAPIREFDGAASVLGDHVTDELARRIAMPEFIVLPKWTRVRQEPTVVSAVQYLRRLNIEAGLKNPRCVISGSRRAYQGLFSPRRKGKVGADCRVARDAHYP
jgi:hypothetical protein